MQLLSNHRTPIDKKNKIKAIRLYLKLQIIDKTFYNFLAAYFHSNSRQEYTTPPPIELDFKDGEVHKISSYDATWIQKGIEVLRRHLGLPSVTFSEKYSPISEYNLAKKQVEGIIISQESQIIDVTEFLIRRQKKLTETPRVLRYCSNNAVIQSISESIIVSNNRNGSYRDLGIRMHGEKLIDDTREAQLINIDLTLKNKRLYIRCNLTFPHPNTIAYISPEHIQLLIVTKIIEKKQEIHNAIVNGLIDTIVIHREDISNEITLNYHRNRLSCIIDDSSTATSPDLQLSDLTPNGINSLNLIQMFCDNFGYVIQEILPTELTIKAGTISTKTIMVIKKE